MFNAAVPLAALAGCSGERWPDPPAVEQAQYEKDHQDRRIGDATINPSIRQFLDSSISSPSGA
jgi:hypothetical protein